MSKPIELYGKPWSERDYLIVLHYYLSNRGNPRHHLSPYIKAAAAIIGRTPAAVVMRMENYASLDPHESVQRVGLINISRLGEKVFNEWHDKEESLRECALVFIRDIAANNTPTLFDPDPVRLPIAFGKYELLDPIGAGGFGSVYSCLDSQTGAVYALKIIKTGFVDDNETVSRFRREIKALKAISHPHIIKIHEDNLDKTPDYPAFVMDLAQSSLIDYLEDKLAGTRDGDNRPLLPESEAAHILFSVIDGVKALHKHEPPVIHRDIKPDNILHLVDGSWALADFGLTKFLPRATVTSTFATASKQGWGTHGYGAPEQFQDFKLTDERADIYSLGVLTWELLSPSWPPFDRAYTLLPKALEDLVVKATSRDRTDRHQTLEEFERELRAALADAAS